MRIRKLLFLLLFIGGGFPFFACAFEIKKIANIPISGDFSISPAKLELNLTPGEEITKTMTIVNKTGKKMNFEIGFEDFIPSFGEDNPIQLGRSGTGTSLKDFLSVDNDKFSLEHGESATVALSIDIPQSISSSGLFGAAVVSGYSSENINDSTKVLVEIPSLLFIRIAGDERPAGELTDFKYGEGVFSVTFENKGNVHLNPVGEIELKNIFGETVKNINVDQWFVLPFSARETKVFWRDRPDLYIYEVDLKLHPGFGGIGNVMNKKLWIYSLGKSLFFVFVFFVVILFITVRKFLRK